jgi:hypothetical protein
LMKQQQTGKLFLPSSCPYCSLINSQQSADVCPISRASRACVPLCARPEKGWSICTD